MRELGFYHMYGCRVLRVVVQGTSFRAYKDAKFGFRALNLQIMDLRLQGWLQRV